MLHHKGSEREAPERPAQHFALRNFAPLQLRSSSCLNLSLWHSLLCQLSPGRFIFRVLFDPSLWPWLARHSAEIFQSLCYLKRALYGFVTWGAAVQAVVNRAWGALCVWEGRFCSMGNHASLHDAWVTVGRVMLLTCGHSYSLYILMVFQHEGPRNF